MHRPIVFLRPLGPPTLPTTWSSYLTNSSSLNNRNSSSFPTNQSYLPNYYNDYNVSVLTRYTSQITSNQAANSNLNEGIALLQKSDKTLAQVQDYLSKIQSLINQPIPQANVNNLISSYLKNIDYLFNNTYFHGRKVFDSGIGSGTIISNLFNSSNSGVVSSDTLYSNTNWSHTISVTKLAQALQVASNSQTSSNTALGLNGSFKINGVTINVSNAMTLNDIINQINQSPTGVTASISNNKLMLTSNTTGISSVFTASDITGSYVSQSTNPAVATINAVLDNSSWSHNVTATQLAQKMEVQGTAQTSATNALNLNGSFNIGSTVFNVTSTQSLTDIKNMINNANIGVTASIDSNNQLHLASNTTGASSAFSLTDQQTTSNTASTVATINNVLSNTDWSENINVTQLAGTKTDYSNDFSSTDMSGFAPNSEWTISGERLNVNDPRTGGSSLEIVGSENYSLNRTISTDMQVNSTSAGIMIGEDPNGNQYYSAQIDNTGKLSIRGFGSLDNFTKSYQLNLNGNTDINMAVTTDSNNNVTVTIKDLSGNILGTINDNLNTLAGRTVNLSGFRDGLFISKMGTNSFDNVKVTENVKAIYSVNGTQYTSDSNSGIILTDPTSGTQLANINLIGVGSTTLSNSTGILKKLGLLNSDGTIKNQISTAQDLLYSVDGNNYSSNINNPVNIRDFTTNSIQASVQFNSIGSTVISNQPSSLILQTLGVLTNGGSYQNILQNAQDAQYTVDGVSNQSSTNSVLLKNGTTNLAGITLKGLGSSTIQNQVTTSGSSSSDYIKIHDGWAIENGRNLYLSSINFFSLGIVGLNTYTQNASSIISSALNRVADERDRLNTQINSLKSKTQENSTYSDSLNDLVLQIQNYIKAKNSTSILQQTNQLSNDWYTNGKSDRSHVVL